MGAREERLKRSLVPGSLDDDIDVWGAMTAFKSGFSLSEIVNTQIRLDGGGREDAIPNKQAVPTKTCRCCGLDGFHWVEIGGKWRLFDASGVHICPVNPLKE